MEPIVKITNGLEEGEDTEWYVDPTSPGIAILRKKEVNSEENTTNTDQDNSEL
jgi:hypothetical protein